MGNGWQELYRAALVELCPEELGGRIAAAENAIMLRLAELREGDSGFEEERRALEDAMRSLRVLAASECSPSSSVSSRLAPRQVMP